MQSLKPPLPVTIMSQISSREKKLVWLVFAVLFMFGNVIALRWWSRELGELKKQQHALDLALIEDEALYQEREEWQQRQLWMDSAIKPFPGREAADAQLLKLVQSSAQAAGLVLDSSELLEPSKQSEAYFARAGVRVKATGTLEQLVKWIHGLQEPVDFRSLTNFEFENDDKKPGMVHCRFQCWEWRKKPSAETNAEVAINDER